MSNTKPDIIASVRQTLEIEAEAISAAVDRVGEEFLNAVNIVYACQGRLVVTGMGKSGIVGKKIAATLASTGTPSLFLHPAEGVHGDLGMVVRGDVVLALSNSGETSEILSILPTIKRFRIPLISIVGKVDSTLARRSDVVLDGSVNREACPMNLAPTASTTLSLALGDALAVALLEKRGFGAEDFAVFHPSGSLGKKLLTTVEEVFHTGDKLPVVTRETPVARALLTISEKGFGCTAVVDDDGVLVGILTDGDLRRGMEKHKEIFSMSAMELGSPDPKRIEKTALAAKALAIMEQHSITSLLAVDEKGRPEGIVHLHDLLRAGIV